MTTRMDAGHPPVIIVAQTVMNVLRRVDVNLSFALSGEAARNIYCGLGVAPLQLDVVILSHNVMLEPLQHAIVQADPAHFSFCQSSESGWSLCFHDGNDITLLSHGSYLHIPLNITVSGGPQPRGCLCDVGGLPLVPLSFLILRRLEQWDIAFQELRRGSALIISKEIRAMLQLLRASDLHRSQPPFDPHLHNSSRERVTRFLALHNSFGKEWRKIGFGTSKETNIQVSNQEPMKKKKSKKKKQRNLASAEVGGPSSLVMLTQNFPNPSESIGPEQLSQPNSSPLPVPSAAVAATAESTKVPSNPNATSLKKAKRGKEPRISFTQVRRLAAQTAVRVLYQLGFSCAIFGSFACKLYGNSRIPNDVDILVLPPPESSHTQEDIKEALVSADPDHFILKEPRDPAASYRVLYFCLSASASASTARSSSSKVDILLPDVMHLPALPTSLIEWKGELPVVPLSVLILQKLQGWDDHRNAVEERYKKKVPADVKDVVWLIGGGDGRNAAVLRDLKQRRPWNDRALFSEEFERLSRERVISFCEAFPQHVNIFRNLGFATARDLDAE